MRISNIFYFLVLVFISKPFAFGELGHQLVAAIAQDLLTPKAKAEVQSILKAAAGGEAPLDLIQISLWADKIRILRPETASWHYVNLQLDERAYDSIRTPKPNVVLALEKQWAILSQPNRDRYEREEALKWVVHLVGDMHQPLHVGEDHDKGGNLVKVKVNRRTYKLHQVFDFVLLEKLNQSLEHLHQTLIQEIVSDPAYLARSREGAVRDWVNATHVRARSCYTVNGKMLKKGIKQSLDKEYIQASTLMILDQIKIAGIRLALVLNSSLDPAAKVKKKNRPNPSSAG